MPKCIFYIGKFDHIWNEECIAKSLEELGVNVHRQDENEYVKNILANIDQVKPDLVMFAKLNLANDPNFLIKGLKERKIPSVSWTFDLYFDYVREKYVPHYAFMKADHVFTTDGGHDVKFTTLGINHHLLRQGIYEPEAIMYPRPEEYKHDIIFVGSHNPNHPYRQALMKFLEDNYGDKFKWYGKDDTNDVRSLKLNELFAQSKIVIGDSVPSPKYWSNRIYESLGRGAFLISPEIEGLEKEFEYYKHFIPYTYYDFPSLKKKIDYYLTHDEEREKIRQAGFEFTKANYTYKKRCEKLLQVITGTKE